MTRALIALLATLLLGLGPAHAAESTAVISKRDTVTLISDTDAVATAPYRLGLKFVMAPGWHTYGRDPGEAGLPPELTWTLPAGTTTADLAWPPTERLQEGPIVVQAYTGTVVLPIQATGPGPIRLHATWLICANICVPEEGEFTLALAAGTPTPSAEATQFAAPTIEATQAFWPALGFALLGGLILNLMPCVFPILAMKAMAIARLSTAERQTARRLATGYSAGVIVSFASIGAGVIILRQLGHAAGWGFQFQSPIFVAVMAWVLLAVGLNLSGVFEVSGRIANIGQNTTRPQGWAASFLGGALAVLVATPCTAPFMSVALAAALTAPPPQTLAIFTALGIGLAAPATALALFPGAASFLPRPGRWMETLRQALAFPIYAACVWLVWVLSLQAGADGVLTVGAGLVLIAFAAWAWRFRRTGRILALAACLAALALLPSLTAAKPLESTEQGGRFTPARLAELRAAGRPVFVNLTAAWCVTCLLNERVALSSSTVRQAFETGGVTLLTGDWTRSDPDITAFLKAQGRDGVPLYIFYPADHRPPVILPQLLTPAIVLEAMPNARTAAVQAAGLP